MKTPLAIVNLRSTSRPIAAIKYFSNPKKVVAIYDGLDAGVATGTPKELADLLLAYHHDPRAKRVCRTAVISVQTPRDATPEQLADIDRRLLQAARDFQKLVGVASMLGWIHGGPARHLHIIFANSNGRRTLDLRPRFLKELQGFLWTIQFLSGRGKGRRKALPMYPKARRLDVRVLAVALLDSNGQLRRDRWDNLVKTGKVRDFRVRKNGSLISFNFQGRRIRMNTLKNFLGYLSGPTSARGFGENTIGGDNDMNAILDPTQPIPDEVQESLQSSGFTSDDVQQILSDVREAQAHLVARPIGVKTVPPKIDL